jgi:hypothetical protein
MQPGKCACITSSTHAIHALFLSPEPCCSTAWRSNFFCLKRCADRQACFYRCVHVIPLCIQVVSLRRPRGVVQSPPNRVLHESTPDRRRYLYDILVRPSIPTVISSRRKPFSVIVPLIGPPVFLLVFLTLVGKMLISLRILPEISAHRLLIGYVYGRTHSQTGGLLASEMLRITPCVATHPSWPDSFQLTIMAKGWCVHQYRTPHQSPFFLLTCICTSRSDHHVGRPSAQSLNMSSNHSGWWHSRVSQAK